MIIIHALASSLDPTSPWHLQSPERNEGLLPPAAIPVPLILHLLTCGKLEAQVRDENTVASAIAQYPPQVFVYSIPRQCSHLHTLQGDAGKFIVIPLRLAHALFLYPLFLSSLTT